jgi:hypothetical protein
MDRSGIGQNELRLGEHLSPDSPVIAVAEIHLCARGPVHLMTLGVDHGPGPEPEVGDEAFTVDQLGRGLIGPVEDDLVTSQKSGAGYELMAAGPTPGHLEDDPVDRCLLEGLTKGLRCEIRDGYGDLVPLGELVELIRVEGAHLGECRLHVQPRLTGKW